MSHVSYFAKQRGYTWPILGNIMHYVYLIESQIDRSWYIGETYNLKKRFSEHNLGQSRYTKHKKPWKLIYGEVYIKQKDAKARE